MIKHTYGASYLTTNRTYEPTQVTRLSRCITRLFRTISNCRKPTQSLLMNETEEEPYQRRGDSEEMCSYDFLIEHEYQQVSTPRSCEMRSLETDHCKTFPVTKASEKLPLPTSETTGAFEKVACNGSGSQCQLSTLATTHDYECLSTYGIKQPTLPIPKSTGLATSDIQAKGHARLRITTI